MSCSASHVCSSALQSYGGRFQRCLRSCLSGRTRHVQVRVIVERLARRCGYDAVAAVIPESDRKLLVHIRKERVKKDSHRHDAAGSQVRVTTPPTQSYLP